jgi:hypothetical protein
MSKIITLENVRDIVERNNCHLVSQEYRGIHEKLDIQCSCGNIFQTSLDTFIHRHKNKCNACVLQKMSKERTKTHEEYVEQINSKYHGEYTILSEYTDPMCKMTIQHNPCMHKRITTAYGLLRGNIKCPKCEHNKRSKEIIAEI